MALAILELLEFDNGNIRFKIDTGGNRYYQLRFGKAVQPRFGLDWVDDVIYATPMAVNEAGGELLNSSKEISVPASRLDAGHAYAQLFSFKNQQGTSPAFSRVVKVPIGAGYSSSPMPDFAPSFSLSTFNTMNTCKQFNPPRYVPCKTGREPLARSASLEELLAGISPRPSFSVRANGHNRFASMKSAAYAQPFGAAIDDGSVLSSKAVVSFEMGDQVSWNGAPRNLFARNQPVQLRLQLKSAEPAPKSPLPKAIVKIVFQDSANTSVRVEKTFKQKDVAGNQTLTFAFQAGELVQLPANKPLSVLAEFRWLTKSGRQYKALGSTEIVLVNKCFLKAQGKELTEERELVDMKQFRPFWNKVWESPVLDAVTSSNGNKKYLWELNVNAKYAVLLSADQEANGLMETKVLRGKPDEESLTETIDGRMKAGIELSIAELNKLLPLWNGVALDNEKLEALKTADFAKNNSGEFIYNLKLKGRAAERGMVWVVPIFKLFECTLSTVSKTDDMGQVVSMNDEQVRFPLPVSARVIGLKSQ